MTLSPTGKLVPIKSLQAIAGIETHPTPKLDFNVYGGAEYFGRTVYTSSSLFGATAGPYVVGYGSQYFSNSTCQTEGSTASATSAATGYCTGNNQWVWAIQPQLWYRFWKGKQGTMQIGASYAYVYRQTWAGLSASQSTTGVASIPTSLLTLTSPSSIENVVMLAYRWYLP